MKRGLWFGLLLAVLPVCAFAGDAAKGVTCSEYTNGANACNKSGCFICTSGTWVEQPLYIGSTTAICASTTAALTRYNAGAIEVCNGTAWVGVGSGASIVLGSTATGANPYRSGDVTTGLFSPAASTVAIATAGIEAMRVTATGSVGIGTTAPISALQVAGAGSFGTSAAITPQVVVLGGSGGADMFQLQRTSGATLNYGWNLSGGKLTFTNNTAAKATFQTSYGATTASTAEINIGFDYGAASTSAGDNGLIKGSDAGGAATNAAGGSLSISAGRGTGDVTPAALYFQTTAAGASGTTKQSLVTRMTIDGSGRVGIGTASPAYPLTVNGSQIGVGTGTITMSATVLSVGNTNTVGGSGGTAFGSLNSVNYGSVGMGISNTTSNAAGALAMGSSNSSTWDNTITIGVGNSASNSNGIAIGRNVTNSDANSLQLGVSNTAKITILTSGNVGIGTTSPNTNLDVSGYIEWIGQSRVTSTFSKTSSTALTAITGLSATLAAGKTYEFTLKLYTTSISTAGIKFDLNGGTATATSLIGQVELLDDTGVFRDASRFTAFTDLVCDITSILLGYCQISGTITVNAGGTFIPRFAQNVSQTTASTVAVGSIMIVNQIN